MKRKLSGKKIVVILVLLLGSLHLYAQPPVDPVDLCMRLASGSTNTVEIVMIPTVNISSPEIISEIRFTICWQVHNLTFTMGPAIPPFNVGLQGPHDPMPVSGWYYQTFITQPNVPFGTPISAGQEVVIATFTCTAPQWSFLYLQNDPYMIANNIDYWFEITGDNRTGIFPAGCSSVYISPDLSVPISNWPIYLAVALMAVAVIVMIRRI